MKTMWMGILPGVIETQIQVLDEGETVLKARFFHPPQHPRALETLCEALALWSDRRVNVVLAADDPDAPCATPLWRNAIEQITDNPHYQIELVSAHKRPDDLDPDGELGEFYDVRDLFFAARVIR